MYTDAGFTLARPALKTPKNPVYTRLPERTPPTPALQPGHDGLRMVETAFFATIFGGFALIVGLFAAQLLT